MKVENTNLREKESKNRITRNSSCMNILAIKNLLEKVIPQEEQQHSHSCVISFKKEHNLKCHYHILEDFVACAGGGLCKNAAGI